MHNRNTNTLRHALTAVTLAVCAANSLAFADEAAKIGREGQAFGKQLSNEFSFPTESGGSFNLGNGTTIGPSDLAPSGDGLYVQDPDVQGVQGVYDSDYDMDVTGRAAQGKLYSDAQAMGNPFDPDPAKRDIPGPSTVSGAAYQIVLGVSDARNKVPDLSNDPIISGSGDAMLDDSLLDSFGDCKVETQVTESTRPVRVPEEEFCERVTKPAASSCQAKREIEVSSKTVTDSSTYYDRWENYCSLREWTGPAAQALCSGDYTRVTTTGGIRFTGSCNSYYYNGVKYVEAIFQETVCNGNIRNVSVTITREKTVPTIKTDRWYPEECVARAQRG